ncbi:cupin domain-containing protein [Flavobacterium rhizosphaerae]|uniref:Cupin domain-containing protein n=1 Tax=Flavobacterium rhizosphaerae TaxID=3163298 RepID=A0ABW8Z2F1_9FLAO
MPDDIVIYHNPINGEYTKVLQSAAATCNAYSLFEVSLKPGGGNPMHFHKTFSEEFFAVKGILGIQKGKVMLHLKPGENTIAYPLEKHRFFNNTNEEIIFRVKLSPGQPDFENFLKTLFGLVQQKRTFTANQFPKNIFHIAILYHWGDTHPVNPLILFFSPLAGFIYRIAVTLGIEKRLIEKYCY